MKSIKKEARNHETWFSNYQDHSLALYQRAWKFWKKYLGDKNETWVLANKDVEDWGAHLVNFHRWIKKQPKENGPGFYSDNSAKVYVNGIRGYLRHIGVVTDLDRVQRTEISNVESQPTLDYPFDLKTKEALLRVANTEEEYIVSVGVSFGLRIGDFRTITRGILEPLLNKEVPIQLPKIMTKKEGVPAYPFIDRDAKEAIRRLLREMNFQGKTKPSDRMLDFTNRQINDMLKTLYEKAGVPIADYTVRFHILRKFLTDKLSNVCSSDKWKWFVGKKTTSPYVSSEGLEAYKKVMEFTCVNGNRVRETSGRIEELERELEELKKWAITPDQWKIIQQQQKQMRELIDKGQEQQKQMRGQQKQIREQAEEDIKLARELREKVTAIIKENEELKKTVRKLRSDIEMMEQLP